MKPQSAIRQLLLVGSIAAVLATPVVQAANLTWDATAGGAINDGGGAWLGAGLWNNAGSPSASWTSGDDAIFGNGGVGGAVTLASPTTVASLTFNAFTGTYTLGTAAQTITLNSGLTMNAGSGIVTIISPLALAGAQTWTNNSTTNALTASAVVSGTGGLSKAGTGTLNLNGVNTFTGAISVDGGILAYGSNAATIANSITIAVGASLQTNSGFGQALTFSAPITNNGTIVRNANGGSTFSNVISGSGSVSNGGAGQLTLNGNNLFSGGVTHAGDSSGNNTLTLGNGGALGTGTFTIASNGVVSSSVANLVNANNNAITLSNNFTFGGSNNANLGTGALTLTGANRTITVTNTLTLGGAIGQDVAGRSLTKAGAGILVLGGTGSTYSGGTTVSAGTLRLAASDVLANAGAVTVGGGILDIQTFSDTVGAVTLASGSISGSTGALTGTSYNVQSGTVSAVLAGSGALTKSTAGTVVLSGANTYTGTTTVGAGILTFANQSALYSGNTANWTAANINAKSGGTLAVNVDSAGTSGFDATNLSTLLANVSVASTGASGLLSGSAFGFDTSTATGGTFTLPNPLTNSTGTFGGSVGLTKLGGGTLVLDKANTNTGATAIYGGTLQLDDTGTIAPAPLTNNGTFLVNKTGALTQGTNFPSTINGTGSLNYAGGGTLTLNAANNLSGPTTVTSGTLALTNPLALQSSALVTTGGGTVTLSSVTTLPLGGLSGATGDLASVISSGYSSVSALRLNQASGTLTYGGVIADGATGMTLTKTGAGTQVLQGVNTYTGATTLNAGTVELSGAGSILVTAGITLSGGGLTLTNTAAETAPGRLADGTAITSNGGTITYNNTSGTNVYAETIGSVDLASGPLNIVQAVNQAGTGSQTLTLSGLPRSGANSVVTFSATTTAPNATKSIIAVTGAGATPAGQIIGPWATTGTSAAAQNIYAVYNASGQVIPSTVVDTAETAWINATDTYSGIAGITLTATRTVNALRYYGGASTFALAGFNLQTYGLLFGGNNVMTVSSTGGVLTTPSGGGALYVTAGFSTPIHIISAPIADNGGAVTLVKSGTGTVTLSSTTSNYSGGTVINAGKINVSANTNLGAPGGGITFNGSAVIGPGSATYARSVTINNGAIASFDGGGSTFSGNVTGTGGIAIINTFGSQHTFSGTGNTFEGPVNIGLISGTTGQAYRATFASLADSTSANGRIIFSASAVTHANGSVFEYTGATALTISNRQFELASATANPVLGHQIRSTGTGTLTITTDLIVTTVPGQTLSLGGSNPGANTFAGKISNDSSTAISLTKADAGTWVLTGSNTFTGNTTINAGVLEVGGGGTLGAGNYAGNIANAGTLRVNSTADQILGGVISGAGALIKNNIGTLTLTGADTYTGATTINGGTLEINGSISGSAVTVANTGILEGIGTITGAVTVQTGGTLAAGNSIESLATGALTFNGGSTFAYELNNNATPGVAGDLTVVTGNLSLAVANTTNITFTELGNGSWSAGEKLTLASYSGTWNGGLFNFGSVVADDSTISFSGTDWTFNYNDTIAGTNFPSDLTGSSYVTITAVPEPGAAMSLLAGMGVLALVRRRRV